MIDVFVDTGGGSWTEIGSFATGVATFLVLVAAAIIAWRQVREARDLREAQSRPFVILDFAIVRGFAELTIKNIGATLARDVRFNFDPALVTTLDGPPYNRPLAGEYIFQEGVPSLPPGKEITMVFDNGAARANAGLPDRYEVSVTYRGDPVDRKYEDPVTILDLGIYRGRGPIHDKGLHEIHRVLEKILAKMP